MSQDGHAGADPYSADHTYPRAADAHELEAEHHLPLPSVYPVTLAAGITLLLTGFLYGIAFAIAGLVLLAIALRGWIGEVTR